MSTIYTNARVFVASEAPLEPTPEQARAFFAQAFEVRPDGHFGRVGTTEEIAALPHARRVDLHGQLVLPGFVDGHAHIALLGSALFKTDLYTCKNTEDIQAVVKEAVAKLPPGAKRLRCKHWLQDQTGGQAPASAIDAVAPDTPVYIESRDLHSAFLNTAAFRELGIDKNTPDPDGGKIARDEEGNPSGLLEESAVTTYLWGKLASFETEEEQEADALRAFNAYLASGYTGTVDMAFSPAGYATLRRVQKKLGGKLPIRVSAYWIVDASLEANERLEEVKRVAQQKKDEGIDPYFQTVGIKIISDGVIDGCTAAVSQPYANGKTCGGIWSLEELKPVIKLADALGLQVATHAIGDQAIHNAVEAYAALAESGIHERRHRIEHLELSNPQDVARLGQLGIITSVQAVHADPAILSNWWAMLGSPVNEGRCARAFAYREFVESGAPLVLGTDTPTAPHWALPNMHTAVHRTSALERACEIATTPQFALPLATALVAASRGAAWAVRQETVCGAVQTGLSADFCVVSADVFDQTARGEKHALLDAQVVETYLLGERVFKRE